MGIPEGWKLVPVEPTEHQMRIARGMTLQQEQTVGAEYRAMLAAAATPPQPIYDEAKERELARFSYDADSEFTGGWFDYLYGWLACAQSRAKAGEVGHE